MSYSFHNRFDADAHRQIADVIYPLWLTPAPRRQRRPRATLDRDIKRIVKSVEGATGKSARRVEADPQTGRVAVEVENSATTTNTWDEVLSDAEDKKRAP